MLYIDGDLGVRQNVDTLDELVAIADRVVRNREFGAVFKLKPNDDRHVLYACDVPVKKGFLPSAFCLLTGNRRIENFSSGELALRALANH